MKRYQKLFEKKPTPVYKTYEEGDYWIDENVNYKGKNFFLNRLKKHSAWNFDTIGGIEYNEQNKTFDISGNDGEFIRSEKNVKKALDFLWGIRFSV